MWEFGSVYVCVCMNVYVGRGRGRGKDWHLDCPSLYFVRQDHGACWFIYARRPASCRDQPMSVPPSSGDTYTCNHSRLKNVEHFLHWLPPQTRKLYLWYSFIGERVSLLEITPFNISKSWILYQTCQPGRSGKRRWDRILFLGFMGRAGF